MKRKHRILCYIGVLILGIIAFGSRPTWRIVQTDLKLSTCLWAATVDRQSFETHAPNGDGVDAAKLVMDEGLWTKTIRGLDEKSWRHEPIPDELQERIVDGCLLSSAGVIAGELYHAMKEEDIYWFYLNRYSVNYQNGENLMEPSTNYTFGLMSAERKALYYVKYDS